MLLSATCGRWDVAGEHFVAAQSANERMGCRTFSIINMLEWARMLGRRGTVGDLERARGLLAQCRSEAGDAGMVRVVADCDAEVAVLGRQSPPLRRRGRVA